MMGRSSLRRARTRSPRARFERSHRSSALHGISRARAEPWRRRRLGARRDRRARARRPGRPPPRLPRPERPPPPAAPAATGAAAATPAATGAAAASPPPEMMRWPRGSPLREAIGGAREAPRGARGGAGPAGAGRQQGSLPDLRVRRRRRPAHMGPGELRGLAAALPQANATNFVVGNFFLNLYLDAQPTDHFRFLGSCGSRPLPAAPGPADAATLPPGVVGRTTTAAVRDLRLDGDRDGLADHLWGARVDRARPHRLDALQPLQGARRAVLHPDRHLQRRPREPWCSSPPPSLFHYIPPVSHAADRDHDLWQHVRGPVGARVQRVREQRAPTRTRRSPSTTTAGSAAACAPAMGTPAR